MRPNDPTPSTLWTLSPAALLLLLGCFSCSDVKEPEPKAADQELVALVIVDTLRRDALGCYGREGAQTPHMDAIAAEGARFDQAIAASGWTLPSVASMLTGNWPAMHKALGKLTRLTPITEDLPVATELFAADGYSTLGFANAAFLSPLLGLDRGFDLFDHKHAYNWDIRRADATVDAALSAVDQHAGEKIFLLLHIFDAHLDYDPPDGFITPFVGERRTPDMPISMQESLDLCIGEHKSPPAGADIDYLRGAYQGEIAFVDTAIGRFVGGLKELGRWDHTTIVVTSDHGEEFWDHGGFEHGHTLYDELVRVPLLIRTPQSSDFGTHIVDRQVRTIDIMPTLFDLVGIRETPSFVGESLVPDLKGQSPANSPPAFSQGTLYGADKMSWRHNGYNLIVDQAKSGPDAVELYDLSADPLQLDDISRDKPKLTLRYSNELKKFSRDLEMRASTLSTPDLQNMGPKKIKEYEKSLEALGYSGRDGDSDDQSKE